MHYCFLATQNIQIARAKINDTHSLFISRVNGAAGAADSLYNFSIALSPVHLSKQITRSALWVDSHSGCDCKLCFEAKAPVVCWATVSVHRNAHFCDKRTMNVIVCLQSHLKKNCYK